MLLLATVINATSVSYFIDTPRCMQWKKKKEKHYSVMRKVLDLDSVWSSDSKPNFFATKTKNILWNFVYFSCILSENNNRVNLGF